MKVTKSQLRKIIKEEIADSSGVVQIPGMGTLEKDQVIRSIERKLQDMINRNSKLEHNTLGPSQFGTLLAMWEAVSEPRE